MQIQLEPHETNTIQSYSETFIRINDISYHTSFIVNQKVLIAPWDEKDFKSMLDLAPEIVIIGTHHPETLRQHPNLVALGTKGIGVECLQIGAACRTFNILLSELRRVAAGFILSPS